MLAAPTLCAGLTAYKAVLNANLKPSSHLVVLGAGGGLGHYAVQYGLLRTPFGMWNLVDIYPPFKNADSLAVCSHVYGRADRQFLPSICHSQLTKLSIRSPASTPAPKNAT